MCQKEDQVVQVWQKLRLVLAAFGLNHKNMCFFSKRIFFLKKVPKVVAWSIQNDETGNILKPRGNVHIVKARCRLDSKSTFIIGLSGERWASAKIEVSSQQPLKTSADLPWFYKASSIFKKVLKLQWIMLCWYPPNRDVHQMLNMQRLYLFRLNFDPTEIWRIWRSLERLELNLWRSAVKKGCSLSAAWGRDTHSVQHGWFPFQRIRVESESEKPPEVTKNPESSAAMLWTKEKEVTQRCWHKLFWSLKKCESFRLCRFSFFLSLKVIRNNQWISVPRQQQYGNNVNIDKLTFNYQKYDERRGRNQGVSDWRLERSVDWKERWHISDCGFKSITNPWYGWWKKSCTTWDV